MGDGHIRVCFKIRKDAFSRPAAQVEHLPGGFHSSSGSVDYHLVWVPSGRTRFRHCEL